MATWESLESQNASLGGPNAEMAWQARTLGWQHLDAYYRGIFLWLMRVSVVNIFSRKLTTL